MSRQRDQDPQRVVRIGGIVVSSIAVAIAIAAGIIRIVNLDRAGEIRQRDANVVSAVIVGVVVLALILVLTRLVSLLANHSRSGIASLRERFPLALVAAITAVELPLGQAGGARGSVGPSLGVRFLVVDNGMFTVWGGLRKLHPIASVDAKDITRISVRAASVKSVDYWAVCVEVDEHRSPLQFAVDRDETGSILRSDRAAVERFAESLRGRTSR
jgi:hypothetical protein